MQPLPGGGVRIAPRNDRSRAARQRAAAYGLSGIQHRGRAGETRPGAGLSFGGVLRGIASVGGALLTGGPVAALGAGYSAVTGGRPSAPSYDAAATRRITGPSTACTWPMRPDPVTGDCKVYLGDRPGPDDQVYRPGGGPSEAVMGGFGVPALTPDMVGTITRRDGTSGPILRCIPGMVLGKDDLCYPKSVLGRRSKFRKHRAPTRPPVTSGDTRHIRKAASARNRAKELAKDLGFKVTGK